MGSQDHQAQPGHRVPKANKERKERKARKARKASRVQRGLRVNLGVLLVRPDLYLVVSSSITQEARRPSTYVSRNEQYSL